jgi:hypothetical protein
MMQSYFLPPTFVIVFPIPANGYALIPDSHSALMAIFRDLDERIGERRSIFKLYRVHHIKRRRLYDVLNVLAAIGFVIKVAGDEIQCNGRNEILPNMLQQKRNLQIDKFSIPLTELFPPEH